MAALFPTICFAEDVALSDDRERVEDTIIITGTKRNKSLQDTQASVAIFTEEQIEEGVLFSLDDVLLRTPNVSALNVQTGFALRGISQAGVGFSGTGATSNIYVDGAPLSTESQQGVQSLWDVDQVEVLRGPQSTVQGRNALAGALIVKTKDPSFDWTFQARAHIGTEETRRGSFAISGPILKDQIAFRLAYDYQNYEGDLIEATTGIPQEFQESHTVRGKLLFRPAAIPDLEFKVTGEYVDTEFGEFNAVFAPVSFSDPTFESFDPFGGETFTRVRLENPTTAKLIADVTFDVNDNWQLIGLGTLEKNDRDRQFGTPINGDVFLSSNPVDTDTYTAEFRSAFDYGLLSGWIGAYYFENQRDEANSFSFPAAGFGLPVDPPTAIVTINAPRRVKTENQALFADLTFQPNTKWAFNFGVRYDWEDFQDTGQIGSVSIDPETCTLSLPSGDIPCIVAVPVQNTPGAPASFEAFLPRGTITYFFDQDKSVSVSAQRGYRAGGAIIRTTDLSGSFEVTPFDPEFVTNYEVALRSVFLNGDLVANANFFFTEWTDQQVTIPGATGQPFDRVVVNAGESTIYGAEFSVDYRLSDNLRVFGSLGLLETEFDDFAFAGVPGEFENLSGNAFPAAPNVSLSIGGHYAHDSGVYGDTTISYRGKQESDVTNLAVNQVGDATLVNARIGYRRENWNLYAFASNLFDERFATRKNFAAVETATGLISPLPNARFEINEPRVVGVALELGF